MIGTIYGEITLLRNAGSKGKPTFPEMTTLVEALPGDSGAKLVKRVPANDGVPVGPGSSFHIEPVDYDGDGDLDLLVGGRSAWLTGPEKEPTEEDLELAKKLKEESSAAWKKFKEFKATAEGDDELEELKGTEKYKELLKNYRTLSAESRAVTADPIERGDFVWLFRRK